MVITYKTFVIIFNYSCPNKECNLEQHPDDAHSFWVPNVASSIMKCKTGMFFSNSECTCIPEADDSKSIIRNKA